MNLTYFLECKDNDEAKKFYRELAKKFHPDLNKGIDVKLIQQLNAQWEYITENGIMFPLGKKESKTVDDTPNYVDHKFIINNIIKLKELRGYQKGWVFFTFIHDMEVKQERVTEADLQYMAFKLGYSEGWVYWKKKELNL